MVAGVVAAQAVTATAVPIVPSPPATLTAAALAAVMLPRNMAAAEAIGRATEAAAVERAVRAVAKLIARVTTPVALVVVVGETLIVIAAVANVIVIDEALITAAVSIVGIEDGIETRVIPAMIVLVAIISAARDTAAVAATRAVAITSIEDAPDPDHAPNRAAHTTPMRRRPLPRRNIRATASVIEINIDIYICLFSLLLIVYELIYTLMQIN